MREKIVKVKDVVFVVKNYEFLLEYLLGELDRDKYIIHLYKDKNEEDKYYIDLTDDDYFLIIMGELKKENFEMLFEYKTLTSEIEYGNIEKIKKIYGIEDISYTSNLNEKLKNVLFNINNRIVNIAYVFFENYLYKLINSNNFFYNTTYEIFRNTSNLKNCIINSYDDIFKSFIISIEKENVFREFIEKIRLVLTKSKILENVDALLKYDDVINDKILLEFKTLKIRKFTEIGDNSLIKREIILLYIIFTILFDVQTREYRMSCNLETITELIKSYLDSGKLDSDLFYSLFSEIYSLL